MRNEQIDIRQQLITYKILPGFQICKESPVEIQRVAFLQDQVSGRFSLQLKLRLTQQYENSGIESLVLQGSLLNSVQDVVENFSIEYKGLSNKGNTKYFGTKNIIQVQGISDYIRINNIKFVCNGVLNNIDVTNFEVIQVQDSGIHDKRVGKFQNEVLFKPLVENLSYGTFWVCSCGTLNRAGEVCGTCGCDIEQANNRVDPSYIAMVEQAEKQKRAVEKQAQTFKTLDKTFKIVVGFMLGLQAFQMLFDRVPVMLRYDRDDVSMQFGFVIIGFILHIAMQILGNKVKVQQSNKLGSIETYGTVMQLWLTQFMIVRIFYDLGMGRDASWFIAIDGIYVVALISQLVQLIQSIKYNKAQLYINIGLQIIQVIQTIYYIQFQFKELADMQTMAAVEGVIVALSALLFLFEIYQIYFIQLSNRAVRDPTIRFNERF